MGIGIFNRLNFPASMANNTIEFSESTQRSLSNLPPILTTWQMQDIANNNVGGYFKNPVAGSVVLIKNVTSNIVTFSAGVPELANISNACVGISNTFTQFTEHTNRISGVTPFDAITAGEQLPLQPYYENCIGTSKSLTYLIYQSDGISNNAVIMGNFGSLYAGNTLTDYYNTLSNDLILIQNSLSSTTSGSGTEQDPFVTSNTSNLGPTTVAQIASNIVSMNVFLTTSITQDVNFYYNSRAIMDDYSKVRGFTSPGDSEKNLYQLIGSDKLKSRI